MRSSAPLTSRGPGLRVFEEKVVKLIDLAGELFEASVDSRLVDLGDIGFELAELGRVCPEDRT